MEYGILQTSYKHASKCVVRCCAHDRIINVIATMLKHVPWKDSDAINVEDEAGTPRKSFPANMAADSTTAQWQEILDAK